MGSSSFSQNISTTSAIDKRQVTSENAVGFSVDGSNNMANNGQLITGSTINAMDGGAIGAAFDFANKSLSSMIALAVDRGKTAEAAANSVQDSAAASIATIGQTTAQTAAAVNPDLKAWLIYGVMGVGAVWLWGNK